MDESVLSERVSRLLLSGELPTTVPERCVGGPGSGRRCDVCRMHIEVCDLEVEVDGRFSLHPGCYLLWVTTVRRLAA